MQTDHDTRANKGFTLVEIAIVVVIIGLVVGGIIVGKDLVEAAKVRSTMTSINQYSTAMNTFKLKYGFWPGDIPYTRALQSGAATSDLVAWHGSMSGNGDGSIKDNLNRGLQIPTKIQFQHTNFVHEIIFTTYKLFLTGLIGGGPYATPGVFGCCSVPMNNNAYSSSYYPAMKTDVDAAFVPVTNEADEKIWFLLGLKSNGTLANATDAPTGSVPNGAIYASVANMIDSKLDDGIPITGTVRAVNRISDGWGLRLDTFANVCSRDTTGMAYNTANNVPACRLIIRMP